MKMIVMMLCLILLWGCDQKREKKEGEPKNIVHKKIDQSVKVTPVLKTKKVQYNQEGFKRLQNDQTSLGRYRLAQFYFNGYGVVSVNPQKGAEYLRESLKKGSVIGAVLLGQMILTRRVVVKDQKEGTHLISENLQKLEKGAVSDPIAMGLLGNCYHRGFGVKKNEKKSYELAAKGAKLGDPESAVLAGFHLYSGIGTTENLAAAIKLVTPIGNQGHAAAQFALGYFYENKTGSSIWLKKSAKQQFSQAQFLLGLKYLRGSGVNMNIQLAQDYIKEAADNGNEKAIQFLKKFKEVPRKKDYSKNQRLK